MSQSTVEELSPVHPDLDPRIPTYTLDVIGANLGDDEGFRAQTPEGLYVVLVRGERLSDRDLHAVHRFRLVQYLQRGWVDQKILAERQLSAEPYGEGALRAFHVLAIESASNILRGYGTITFSSDSPEVTLGDNRHRPFVVERDYQFRLAEHLGEDTLSSQVSEIKRLVRDHAMPRSVAGATVPWWVYLAWTTGCRQLLQQPGSAVVGDGKAEGTIAQFKLLGFATRVVDIQSRPPEPGDLFAPLWDQENHSSPFILTDQGSLAPTLRHLEKTLMSGDLTSIRQQMVDFAAERGA